MENFANEFTFCDNYFVSWEVITQQFKQDIEKIEGA